MGQIFARLLKKDGPILLGGPILILDLSGHLGRFGSKVLERVACSAITAASLAVAPVRRRNDVAIVNADISRTIVDRPECVEFVARQHFPRQGALPDYIDGRQLGIQPRDHANRKRTLFSGLSILAKQPNIALPSIAT